MSTGKRIRELVRGFDELDAADPEAIHRAAVDAVREASRAKWAIFHDLVEIDGKNRVSTVCVAGDCDAAGIERNLRRAKGGPLEIIEFRRPPDWVLDTFASPRELFPSRDAFEASDLFTVLWKPYGTHDIAGLIVYQGPSLVGVVSGSFSAPREFCAADRELLQPLVRPLGAALTAAHCLSLEGLPTEPAYLLVKPDGKIDHVSAAGRHWIRNRAFAAAVSRRVKDLDGRNEPREASSLDKAEARVARLRTADGIRYLVSLSPAPPLRRGGAALLTPLQLRIAIAAAEGATVKELARDVGRSAETVRDHLAAIYRKLGVSSRIELVRALRDSPPIV